MGIVVASSIAAAATCASLFFDLRGAALCARADFSARREPVRADRFPVFRLVFAGFFTRDVPRQSVAPTGHSPF
jgi:hypothetical protein